METVDKIQALRASVDGINVEERTTRQRIQEIKSLMAETTKRKEILAGVSAEEAELLKQFAGKTGAEVVKALNAEKDHITNLIAQTRHNVQSIKDVLAESTKRKSNLADLQAEEAALLKELEAL
jgi:biotin-(acetyl-CoA carboxylase) ligase